MYCSIHTCFINNVGSDYNFSCLYLRRQEQNVRGLTMAFFILGLFIFLGVHSISIVDNSWRDRMVGKIGEGPWKGLYSLVSISGFILIIWGYGLARSGSIDLYTPQRWLQHLSLILLFPVFPLLVATYFPGRIKAVVGHPMLVAIKLWAVAHLLSTGALIDVILFGSILIWAVMDRVSLKQRQTRPVPGAPSTQYNDAVAVILGFVLYLAFIFWLHQLFFGVSPI